MATQIFRCRGHIPSGKGALMAPLVLIPQVITSSPGVEKYLSLYKDLLENDYEGYRGHVYRVLTYTNHLLGGDKTHRDAIEAALVFHDIGLWTDGALGYLEPSIERAKEVLTTEFSGEEMEMIEGIILYHHKITPYVGEGNTDHTKVIDAVRKADWIDASMGMVPKGIARPNIVKTEASIPNAGFHNILRDFLLFRIRGWNVPLAFWELSSIMKL
eukprot:jgi/Bigna1/135620/aug1.30_g10328